MSPRRVAVIGAGPAGLVAATHSIREEHHVTVYEQSDQPGGIWVYSDDPKHHSAIYDRMLTNLPKQMMMFNGVKFKEELPSFMTSQQVLDYLVKYAEGLPIQFNTKVVYVSRKGDEWLIRTEHLGETKEELFDVVFVCNGHYVQPRIPFDTSRFTGRLIHSHDYRRAEDFRGRRVAVIGTGPSGIDIALQLADTATEILFIGNRAKYPVLPVNITQYSAHVVAMENNTLTLDNGKELTEVDVAIVCTGYNMDFPFLEKNLIEILHDGQMVSPLWQHVAHKEYPDSLFFIGLNLMVVTNTLFEHQAKFALALVNGKATIPTRQEMDDWEESRMKSLAETGRQPRQFHSMTSEQWAYMDELAEIGHFEKWSHHKVMSKMYDYIFTIRSQDVVNYKKVDFRLDGDDFSVTWLNK